MIKNQINAIVCVTTYLICLVKIHIIQLHNHSLVNSREVTLVEMVVIEFIPNENNALASVLKYKAIPTAVTLVAALQHLVGITVI